ncbi:mitogen-activated protein kinase kinase kinase 4-like [Centruroides sculpturatus]|uniref:mitogen-activated protein kinase kinase kinase 4-like n=1 Tax=Centruroides sculpturatus TaxID=218467 RepID=UPI000C6D4352|nr:mitogen-activated protein kinase kinase kinase 4-like [Centruroides sculpturatus]
MFVPGHLQYNETYIWQLVDMTCGHENIDVNQDQDIYLIMMRFDVCNNGLNIWQGPTILLEPTAEATITLSQIEVDGLLLVVNHSSQLMNQCCKFQKVMGNTLQIEKQQTSCNHAIAEALNALKVEALHLCEKITDIIQEVERQLDVAVLKELDENDRNNILASYREVLHQGFKFGFEFQKGVARLITGEGRTKLGKLLIKFAHQWMKFVSSKCERGRGHRPRWASQGLEFLIAACDPQYLQALTDEEFQELKKSMNNCITHLIGSPLSGSRVTSPTHIATQPNFTVCCQYSVKSETQLPSSPISCPENLGRR